MKQYTKPKVSEGEWFTCVSTVVDGTEYCVKRQGINGIFHDHYTICINGKRQRKTYFGELAHYDVARAYNDIVGWPHFISGDEL